MKLDELRSSQKYKTPLDAQDTWKLLEKHCSDAMKHMDEPIVRGMKRGFKGGKMHGIVDGTAVHDGGRRSKNTLNFYTTILDTLLPPLGFPKRSESIICANWRNRDHAGGYGSMYAIFPFNGVKIGICPGEDMWDTPITLGGQTYEIYDWNDIFDMFGISDYASFADIVKQLEYAKASGKHNDSWLEKIEEGAFKEELKNAYRKPFKATTTKNPIYNDGKPHEVWIGGKCIAINIQLYKEMMDNPPDEDLRSFWD